MSEEADGYDIEDSEHELTPAEYREIVQTDKFLERIREGCGQLNAAIEVGWTPAGLRQRMKDPEFFDLVQMSEERSLEDVEEVLHRKAKDGNIRALQMVLYNRRGHRWKDVRHIKVERKDALDPGVVLSVKAALAESLRSGSLAVAELQPAVGEIIDVPSEEVVRDDGR